MVAPTIRVEGDDSAARLGTATHKIDAAIVAGVNEPDVFEVAADYNVPADELGMLAGMSRRMWREQLASQFPEALPEQSFEYADSDLTLTGTMDIYAEVGDEIRIGDWKTGHRTEHDASEQLKGYAWLALSNAKAFNRVRVYTIFVRDQRVDVDLFHRDELLRWWDWLKGHLKASDIYRPGAHCSYCPRVLECLAHSQSLASMAALVSTDPEHFFMEPADAAAHALQMSRLIAKRIDQFQSTLKAHVAARGGRWGNLILKTTKPKSIDVARAMPHMIEELSEAKILPLLKIGKGDLEDAIKKDAPRGQKGKAVAEFMERLENVGALVETERTTLEVERDYGNSNAIEAGSAAAIAVGANDR